MPGIKLKLFRMTNIRFQSGPAINYYKGVISLQEAKQNDKGIWPKFAYPEKYEDGQKVPGENSFPVGVVLGQSVDEALETLDHFRNILLESKNKKAQPPPEEDIPY